MALADLATMDTINSQHPSPPVIKSCKVCTALEELFADDDVQIQLEKDEIYYQSYTQHNLLFYWIERNYCEYLDRLEKARNYHIVADTNYSLGTVLLFRLSGGISRLWVYSRMGISYGTYKVLHSKISPEKKQKNCSSSVLDPEWVDLGIVREWMERCSEEHESKCQNPNEKHVSPAWPIDTKDDCLVSAPENEEQLAEQLQLMGGIYASAKLTIVALDGDSSTGIVGLRSQSSPRSLSNIFPWQDGRSVRVRQLPSLSVQIEVVSKYFQRGWTFQDYTLSQRRFIFGDQQIHWQCSCATWHEGLPRLEDPIHILTFPNIKNGWPGFEEFNVLLNEYNNR
ncbi:hypothetical protein FOTG_05187 [Fusarium oxysporum f. sp. vasinfectum 25433]|uniref:Heterokaryon incompatibility domain-containing protein n=1 Tax=Fusarium oxysporum f. sp. vasinfectum 25433 TaxID=1089449 RepID=X0M5X9_FUSOX|nr:hypothetical protein FOTG_05187 [Fusarium oxysporum f. sp. vasinfectum 25433]